MSTYSFLDDYSEGCHPAIVEALARTNLTQQTAYGDDEYSLRARTLIREQLGDANLPIHFVASGTVANLIIIASALRPHEAVIAAVSGHIAMRETGAIEATGHKVITMPSTDGKLTPVAVESAVADNAQAPHMAKPRLVYISNATEFGTVYTRTELTGLRAVCDAHRLLLLVDGARLGAALSAPRADVSLSDLVSLADAFWIGGTKAGALIGEAIVLPNAAIAEDFAYAVKQRGALLAKGRLLGLQFQTLFEDGLYFKLAAHANAMAQKLSHGIVRAGHSLAAQTQSNQVFPVLPNALIERLREQFAFYTWSESGDARAVIRLVTSWATDEARVDAFVDLVNEAG
jgi:threonine aldolase